MQDPPLNTINGPVGGYAVYYKANSSSRWSSIGVTVSNKTSAQFHVTNEWTVHDVYISLFNYKYEINSEVSQVLVKGEGEFCV